MTVVGSNDGDPAESASSGSPSDKHRPDRLLRTLDSRPPRIAPDTVRFRTVAAELADLARDNPADVAPYVASLTAALDRTVNPLPTPKQTVPDDTLRNARADLMEAMIATASVEAARAEILDAIEGWLAENGEDRLALGAAVGWKLLDETPGQTPASESVAIETVAAELADLADALQRAPAYPGPSGRSGISDVDLESYPGSEDISDEEDASAGLGRDSTFDSNPDSDSENPHHDGPDSEGSAFNPDLLGAGERALGTILNQFETVLADTAVEVLDRHDGDCGRGREDTTATDHALVCLARLVEAGSPVVAPRVGDVLEVTRGRPALRRARPRALATVLRATLDVAAGMTHDVDGAPVFDDPETLCRVAETLASLAERHPEAVRPHAMAVARLIPGHAYLIGEHPGAVSDILDTDESHGLGQFIAIEKDSPQCAAADSLDDSLFQGGDESPDTGPTKYTLWSGTQILTAGGPNTVERSIETVVRHLEPDADPDLVAPILNILKPVASDSPGLLTPYAGRIVKTVEAADDRRVIADGLVTLWKIKQHSSDALLEYGDVVADAIGELSDTVEETDGAPGSWLGSRPTDTEDGADTDSPNSQPASLYDTVHGRPREAPLTHGDEQVVYERPWSLIDLLDDTVPEQFRPTSVDLLEADRPEASLSLDVEVSMSVVELVPVHSEGVMPSRESADLNSWGVADLVEEYVDVLVDVSGTGDVETVDPDTQGPGSGPHSSVSVHDPQFLAEVRMTRQETEKPDIPVLVTPTWAFDNPATPVPSLALVVDRLSGISLRTAANRVRPVLDCLARHDPCRIVRIALYTIERIAAVRPHAVAPFADTIADVLNTTDDPEATRSAVVTLCQVVEVSPDNVVQHLQMAADAATSLIDGSLQTVTEDVSKSLDRSSGSNLDPTPERVKHLRDILVESDRASTVHTTLIRLGRLADADPSQVWPWVIDEVVDVLGATDDREVAHAAMYVLERISVDRCPNPVRERTPDSPHLDLYDHEWTSALAFHEMPVTRALAEYPDHDGIRYLALRALSNVTREIPADPIETWGRYTPVPSIGVDNKTDAERVVKYVADALDRCDDHRSARQGILTLAHLARAMPDIVAKHFDAAERAAERFEDDVVARGVFDIHMSSAEPRFPPTVQSNLPLTAPLADVHAKLLADPGLADAPLVTADAELKNRFPTEAAARLASAYQAIDCVPRGGARETDFIAEITALTEDPTAVAYGAAALCRLAREYPKAVAPHADIVANAVRTVDAESTGDVPFSPADGLAGLADIATVDSEAVAPYVGTVISTIDPVEADSARPGLAILRAVAITRPDALVPYMDEFVDATTSVTDSEAAARSVETLFAVARAFPEWVAPRAEELAPAVGQISDPDRLRTVLVPEDGHPSGLKPVLLTILRTVPFHDEEPDRTERARVVEDALNRLLDGRSPPGIIGPAMDLHGRIGSIVPIASEV